MGYFWPFTPLTAQKIKILQKKKKECLVISSFYKSVPKICYTVPEIWCMTGVTVIFHFGLFFTLLPTSQSKKSNLKKNEKIMPGDINLHLCTKNYDQMMFGSWDMLHKRQLDRGRINGRKSDILRWVPLLITKTTVKIHLCIYFCRIWAEWRVFQVLLQNLSNPKNIALRFAWPSNFF